MADSEKRKVLFIVNPISGSNQKYRLTDEITRICEKHHLIAEFFKTTGENDKQKISKAIEKHAPDVVTAVGGDGTVNMVAGLLKNTGIKLAILPTGSANGMAYELNIPTNMDSAIGIIARNVSKRIDLLMINNQHLAVHLSDLGMNARIIKRFDREKIRGIYGYSRQFFKELKSPSKFKCIVQYKDRHPRKYKAVMVVMLNTHYFGTGAMVNPVGKIDDGKFEIVVIKPYPWYYIFRMFLAFFSGRIHRLRHIRIISCSYAKITVTPPQDLQIDGEPTGEIRNIEIENIPKAVDVIYNDRQEHLLFKPSRILK
ncbi:diacylglycerol/lipid kinase family protein [Marinilabilia rubra]|uniref:Diacylglycerol kinase n=1 Tax=Marinilabilia rubra TaxID=2162893 RepID=A0A2U2B522_9BACT|nr:diacylglycerol kinase family protein [Marinilabilia rubra]PWD98156.1 diacylglycerol kinase [Marinilabilia rubra]